MDESRPVEEVLRDYPKEVILKDGTGVTLRPLEFGDEKALFEMFNRLSEEDLWFLNQDVSDPELIGEWVNNIDPNRIVSIVAVLERRIIGNSALMMKARGAKSHIGKIRISVDPSFREKRLGTWMLFDLVNLAISMGLKTLVIRLIQDRDSNVINGVKKLGFSEEALLEDYILDREGNPHNLVILIKRLSTGWDDF